MMKKKYKQCVNSDLRGVAVRIPFVKAALPLAAKVQSRLLDLTPVPQGIKTETFTTEHMDRRVKFDSFAPENPGKPLPWLLYIHGGGFAYKAAPYHKRLACEYALRAECRVFMPDYSLLPKDCYPCQFEEVFAVYKFLSDFTGGQAKVAVGGDSAGATLAANICNAAEGKGYPTPLFQMLVYPATDYKMSTESMAMYRDTPLWDSKNNKKMWDMYLANSDEEMKKAASPLYSPLPREIPPTYIETAEIDCLRDEGLLYARRLIDAGAEVELNETKGTIHGYDNAFQSKTAQEGIDRRVAALKRAFSK